MKLADYARRHGVSYRTAWRWYKNGTLAAEKVGGTVIVHNSGRPVSKGKYLVEFELDVWQQIELLPISLNDYLKERLLDKPAVN